jgi:hypothetical protein
VEGVRIAVEVKRPLNHLSAVRAMDRSGAQIRDAGMSGFIVADLSEALGTRHLSVLPPSATSTARDMIRPEFTRLATSLEQHIVASQPASHSRTIGLITYARHCSWLPDNPRELDFGFFIRGKVFSLGSAGLHEHYAERLIDRLVPAIESLTGSRFVRE